MYVYPNITALQKAFQCQQWHYCVITLYVITCKTGLRTCDGYAGLGVCSHSIRCAATMPSSVKRAHPCLPAVSVHSRTVRRPHSRTLSRTLSRTHSLTHSLTHSPHSPHSFIEQRGEKSESEAVTTTPSLHHSITPSLTHSLTHSHPSTIYNVI